MTHIKLEADSQSEEFWLKFSRKSNTPNPTRKIAISAEFFREEVKTEELFRLKIWIKLV